MKGVCCGCQCVVEVEEIPRNLSAYDSDLDDCPDTIIITSEHNCGDEPCSGSLLYPQVIVKD